jgi:D-alanyl-D-alanine carboxypeptidase
MEMTEWLSPALRYAADWLAYQVRHHDLPGLQFAAAGHGVVAAEAAWGEAAAGSGERLSSQHRLRVASHSKTFTTAGIMTLVDAGRLRLDDPVGRYVADLHPDTSVATLRQALSHTAGLIRDGRDAGQWQMRRPFLDAGELRQALAQAPILAANTRFKYSNHGFGLLGLIIEAVTGEPYGAWIAREVVAAAGLERTVPDGPIAAGVPRSLGHGIRTLLGQRFVIDNTGTTGGLAAATGFASTAGDLVRFFAQLAPDASNVWLTAAARREMTRRHWRVPDVSVERHYGLGTMHAGEGDWAWFGHAGGFPGTLSHTSVLPAQGVTVSVIINAADVAPAVLVDGLIAVLRAYREGGPPSPATAPWTGRWWSLWGAFDLVPMNDKVLVTIPAQANPMLDAVELTDVTANSARTAKAGGYLSFGEGARLERDAAGQPRALWLGGTELLPEAALAQEVRQRFRVPASAPA